MLNVGQRTLVMNQSATSLGNWPNLSVGKFIIRIICEGRGKGTTKIHQPTTTYLPLKTYYTPSVLNAKKIQDVIHALGQRCVPDPGRWIGRATGWAQAFRKAREVAEGATALVVLTES